ncbi:glycosyltransferase involved in cell wall biosynthesis [Novosphingobium sp. PhB165]|uniref:glycosyltransferase family 4 protein n=1 Tax=Novosphingobium sp. PhB165 TaxID=2485105 RepID=UPI001046183B|nr:glycosyltransferase family 1 protein [Novosphingobium sp. PhB165]TCM18684.1 glycosyltransferase involved in cell wall biosynthesis [Novosphingobium sp. PhB165]
MRAITLRPFFDLLPYRIDQAVTGRGLRAWRVQRRRDEPVRIARNNARASEERRRLYVDLAVISQNDAGTGIQRVVRALALALIEEASAEWEIRFVAANRRRPYHVISWPTAAATTNIAAIKARPGDVFFGLDFSLDTVRIHRRQLAGFQRQGGQLWFLICDLLPVERPEWFSPNNVIRYKAWLEIIAGMAEGFLCISQQTEDDLRRVLADRFGLEGGFGTRIVPMGHAIMDSVLQTALIAPEEPCVRFDTGQPFSLMVGTLEPRKGHADILAAFSELWRQGSEHRLVLVGRMGWQVESLRDSIRNHPEHGSKLLWFDDVADHELEQIYQACEGVIIASHAEGFGLPLIEALGHNKPVLARDLPIFRIHEEHGVRYFPAAAEAKELGNCIHDWIGEARAGRVTVTPPTANWRGAAGTILAALN